jgi:hypothetical protein
MWTLVLFTMLANTAAGGGVQSTVTVLEFNSEAACTAAGKSLAEQGTYMNETSVYYRIFGKCIQRSSVRGRF